MVTDNRLTYGLPEEAEDLLRPVLEPYQQSPAFYFDKLNFGRPPAPWAVVCLDREYALAGHVATARPSDAGINFSPYTQVPKSVPPGFVPGVGTIVIAQKRGLETAAAKSPMFEMAWSALKDRPEDCHWLALLDPLPEPWLSTALSGDAERWLIQRTLQNQLQILTPTNGWRGKVNRSLDAIIGACEMNPKPASLEAVRELKLWKARLQRCTSLKDWKAALGMLR